MLKPSIELTQNQHISDYSLVVGIAKRAREIASIAESSEEHEPLAEKPVDLAVQEYIQHKFRILEPKVCEVCGRLDCICEIPVAPKNQEAAVLEETQATEAACEGEASAEPAAQIADETFDGDAEPEE